MPIKRIALNVVFITLSFSIISTNGYAWDAFLKKSQQYVKQAGEQWVGTPRKPGIGGGCVSCHTALPYFMITPIASNTPDHDYRTEAYNFTSTLYRGGVKSDESNVRKIVVAAAALTLNDIVSGETSARRYSKESLKWMWDLQSNDGSWTWYKPGGWPPFEISERYFGAALAYIAAVRAKLELGEDYPQEKMSKLLRYLQKLASDVNSNSPVLNKLSMLVWASNYTIDDQLLLTNTQWNTFIAAILDAQNKDDGGWSIDSLNYWNCHSNEVSHYAYAWVSDCDGKHCRNTGSSTPPVNDARWSNNWANSGAYQVCSLSCQSKSNCPAKLNNSDGFGTGLLTYILKISLKSAKYSIDGALKKNIEDAINNGMAWLKNENNWITSGKDIDGIPLDGTWISKSRRAYSLHGYIRRAGTAFGWLAATTD